MSDETVIAYMKANGIYDHMAKAAGVVAAVGKASPAVSAVHVASNTDGDKPPAQVEGEKQPDDPGQGGKAMAKQLEIRKRIGDADVVFFKGQANLYVSRPLTEGSAQRLHDWAVAAGIKNVVPPELMHVTQVHSKAEVDTTKLKPLDTILDVPADSRWLSQLGKGNALVMHFRSPELQDRFKAAAAAGASWDFPGYQPHITISYDEPNISTWAYGDPPDVELQLGPEVFQASNDNWVADNKLAKGGDDFELIMKVSKVDDDQHIIGGWASIATVNGQPVIDKQEDIIPIEELEKAFHEYVLFSRAHGDMHETVGSGDLIACMTFTADKAKMGLVAKNEKGELIEGTWVEYLISDMAVWKRIKAGELPEFSIGGRATPYTV